MIIDIKELFDAPGTEIPLSAEIDLSEVDIWGQKVFRSPVRISGVFKNRSGLVTLKYRATAVLEYNCDRCGKETSKEEEYEFEHWLARELESGDENDDYILVPTFYIDEEKVHEGVINKEQTLVFDQFMNGNLLHLRDLISLFLTGRNKTSRPSRSILNKRSGKRNAAFLRITDCVRRS